MIILDRAVYGYERRAKPRHIGDSELVRVPPGTPGEEVRSAVDDHGVAYKLVNFGGVYVHLRSELGARYGVDASTISYVVSGKVHKCAPSL